MSLKQRECVSKEIGGDSRGLWTEPARNEADRKRGMGQAAGNCGPTGQMKQNRRGGMAGQQDISAYSSAAGRVH